MDNEEFQLPKYESESDTFNKNLINKLPHLRKDIKRGEDAQSFDVDDFILGKAKAMVQERFTDLDPENVELVMRCLYQNTPDKEFIVGYPDDGKEDVGDKGDIVVACGFNGGGFQMGPMVARLCIKLLLSEHFPTESIVKLLEIGDEAGNQDYATNGHINQLELLDCIEKKFDPSRQGLKPQ